MPPEGPSPEDPREWLRRARSNLARASQGQTTPDVLFEDTCFDAQQPVLVEDHQKAVATATAVVSWASAIVAAQPKA